MKNKSFFSTLSSDLPAGLVVFLVALPLCLGIALASGTPIISGLIAGVVGGLIVAPLSGSAVGVSGPAAGLVVIVIAAIQELGSFEFFLTAIILSGFIQIALGYLRAGILAYYFPSSVITGMLSGIGILIILKQIPHAIGFDRNPLGQEAFNQPDGVNTFTEMSHAFDAISYGPTLIAFFSLILLLTWESKWIKASKLRYVPGAVIAILFSILLGYSFQDSSLLSLKSDQLVSIPAVEGFSQVKNLLAFPDFSILLTHASVYKIAFVIAAVASIETLLCVEASDKIDPKKRITPTNRELKAQGVGNIVSGLIGGLPVTQVIVRSSANAQAGSQSKVSAIIHGFLLFFCTLFFERIINNIPLASLASILFLVGYKLAKPSLFKRIWAQGPGQFIPFIVTVLGIILTDLLSGVAAGLFVAGIATLYENYKIPFAMVRFKKGGVENIKIRLAEQVNFLHKASFIETLNSLPEETEIHIDASHSTYIHPDIEEIITNFKETAEEREQVVCLHILPHKERKKIPTKRLHNDHKENMDGDYQDSLLVSAGKGKLNPRVFLS